MKPSVDPLTGSIVYKPIEIQPVNTLRALINRLDTATNLNPEFNPQRSYLTVEQKVEKALSLAAECQEPSELANLFLKDHPICYDGFEPSGRMHIAQGVLKAINVNKLVDTGCIFLFWIADWFAMLNNKMGGDLAKIRVVGEYFVEIWKALGMKMENVAFLWASDEI
jgi:tyrosyl-tRNA synthetase